MNTSTKHNNLTAVVSFEGSLEKLYSCLHALDTWIIQIIVVIPENKEIEKKNSKQVRRAFMPSEIFHNQR